MKRHVKLVELMQSARVFADTRVGIFKNVEYVVNDDLLTCINNSYWDDIERFKEYHTDGNLVTPVKIATFTAKWIVRYKPIQAWRVDDNDLSDSAKMILATANELFAISEISTTLGFPIPLQVAHHLFYEFQFRPFSEGLLIGFLNEVERTH